jgi:hypothetical protein
MTRREFIETAFASVAVLTRLHSEEASPSYYYDWDQSPPYTDNPELAGKLVRGAHNRVFLDGNDIGNVSRCQTGANGWVEVPVYNESRVRKYEMVDLWDGGRVLTEEEAKTFRWQQCRPGKLVETENGLVREVEKRFLERPVSVILRGKVEFVILAREQLQASGICTCMECERCKRRIV